MMQYAKLEWKNQQPFSLDFDDVYFSTEHGLAETEHVFIHHNALASRFASLQEPRFKLIETGFGTGLNFLAIAELWLKTTSGLKSAPKNHPLTFTSIEKHPLSPADFARACALWPSLQTVAQPLMLAYQNLHAGQNIISLFADKIVLNLWVGDVETTLPQLNKQADAWLLDGFAPAKNQAMWGDAVFAQMARLSKPNATFATFTSASAVRKGLTNAGFAVQKHAGYGKKREMLAGYFVGASQ